MKRKQFSTIGLAAIVMLSLVVGAGGMATAKTEIDDDNGTDSTDEDGDVFSEEITISYAGIPLKVGTPQDLNDDGVYEDVTGNGEMNVIDAVAHAILVDAMNQGALDLVGEQVTALDIDGDGDLDFRDTLALVQQTAPR